MTHYDIIGDVHGCASKLVVLLEGMGYRRDAAGVHRHPERTAVFVGDLVDRGEEQLETLQLVKAMVEVGSAQIVMGNHEFNAIAWATTHPETGQPLRAHSPENRTQHAAFLEQLSDEQQAYYIDWFTTLPLWLDLGGIRVVHACWHPESMKVVLDATGGTGRLSTGEQLVEANRKGSALYQAVETLLKGPEISLVDHEMDPYLDHQGKERTKARIRWWDPDASTLPDLAELGGARLKNGDAYPSYDRREVTDPTYLGYVYTDEVPLFYGHYWRQWAPVHRDEWTTYTACVDFSAVRGGTLVAYRWNGEPEIRWRNYVPHDPAVVAPTPSED